MSSSAAFDTVRTELERFAGMDSWAARGALQLSLMDAGIEASHVTAAQMTVVVDRLLPKQLQSQKVADIAAVCERIRNALALLAEEPIADSAERVFQRLAG
jgi:hypothetical protein